MTYATGSLITAADLNGFLTTVRNIYGTGTGDRGYGQTTYSQAAVSSGTKVNASQWAALTNMVNTCANHQGAWGPASNYQPLPFTGRKILASDLVGLGANLTALDTNRLTAVSTDMTLTSGAASSVRSGAWNQNMYTVMDMNWASEDAARFFFNSGGQIRVRLTQPAGSTQDAAWSTIFSNIGTVTIGANSSSRSGTAGTMTSTGYYQMVATATQVFTGTDIGGGAYASNDVVMFFNRLNYVGTNGGNGNGIRITIWVMDQHTGVSDSVGTGTSALFDVYRCTSTLTGIAAPTFTLNAAWTGA
jgi:hypothetical protein